MDVCGLQMGCVGQFRIRRTAVDGARRGIRTPDRLINRLHLAPGRRPAEPRFVFGFQPRSRFGPHRDQPLTSFSVSAAPDPRPELPGGYANQVRLRYRLDEGLGPAPPVGPLENEVVQRQKSIQVAEARELVSDRVG